MDLLVATFCSRVVSCEYHFLSFTNREIISVVIFIFDFLRVIMINRIELKGTDFQKIRPIIISKFVTLTLSTFVSHSMYHVTVKPIVCDNNMYKNRYYRPMLDTLFMLFWYKLFFTTTSFYFHFQPFELLKTFCWDSNVDHKSTSGKLGRDNRVRH